MRQTVFDWLAHRYGSSLAGRSAIDLFAGTGALGFEAASRGASHVVLVEKDRRVAADLHATKAKLAALHVRIENDDASHCLRDLARRGERFDIVFLDPPFHDDVLSTVLPRIAAICAVDASVYVESHRPLGPAEVDAVAMTLDRSERAGDVFYHLLHCKNNES